LLGTQANGCIYAGRPAAVAKARYVWRAEGSDRGIRGAVETSQFRGGHGVGEAQKQIGNLGSNVSK
jgi:hypothetical protein